MQKKIILSLVLLSSLYLITNHNQAHAIEPLLQLGTSSSGGPNVRRVTQLSTQGKDTDVNKAEFTIKVEDDGKIVPYWNNQRISNTESSKVKAPSVADLLAKGSVTNKELITEYTSGVQGLEYAINVINAYRNNNEHIYIDQSVLETVAKQEKDSGDKYHTEVKTEGESTSLKSDLFIIDTQKDNAGSITTYVTATEHIDNKKLEERLFTSKYCYHINNKQCEEKKLSMTVSAESMREANDNGSPVYTPVFNCPDGYEDKAYSSQNECEEAKGLKAKQSTLLQKCCLYNATDDSVGDGGSSKVLDVCACGQDAILASGGCRQTVNKSGYGSLKSGPYDNQEACQKASNTSAMVNGVDPLQVSINADSLTSGTLDSINPLRNSTTFGTKANRTPGHILSVLIKNIIFPAAGLLLFLLIVYGGFTIVQGSTMGNDSVVAAGKQRVTAAVVGFLLLFSSYWLWQIVELALGLGATG